MPNFRPAKVTFTLDLQLLACTHLSAHTQLVFEYPLLLLVLSRVCPAGRGPMSAKKAEKLFQRALTLIPRPP